MHATLPGKEAVDPTAAFPNERVVNFDVWEEILKYLEPIIGADSPEEIGRKRKALLKVSLICKDLSELGLDILWRHMTTLEPVVRAINSNASPKNKFMSYHQVEFAPGDSPCWVPRRPMHNMMLYRVKSYLKRIQNLHLTCPQVKETSLWVALSMYLGPGHLLPNIQSLSFVYDDETKVPHWTEATTLFTPGLRSLSLASSEKIAEVLVTVLRSYNIPTRRLSYKGPANKKLTQSICYFKQLESLTLNFTTTPNDANVLGSSILDHFKNFFFLQELDVDLRFFNPEGAEDPSPGTILNCMRRLSLTGSVLRIMQLLAKTESPSLRILSLCLSSNPGSTDWKELSICIASFLSLKSLELSALQDVKVVLPFFIKEEIGKLDLRCIKIHNLLPSWNASLVEFAAGWPNLHSLHLTNTRVEQLFTFRASSLAAFKDHRQIRIICLPLDFSTLSMPSEDQAIPPGSIISNNRLMEIRCPTWSGIPEGFAPRMFLIRNLLGLFPSLQELAPAYGASEPIADSDLGSLQEAINTFRALCRAYVSVVGCKICDH